MMRGQLETERGRWAVAELLGVGVVAVMIVGGIGFLYLLGGFFIVQPASATSSRSGGSSIASRARS
jgi:hypothetical protein